MNDNGLIKVTVDATLFTPCGDRVRDFFEVELANGSKVLNLLEILSVRFPDILLVEEEKICHAFILIDQKSVSLDTFLKNGDKVSIYPLIDGG